MAQEQGNLPQFEALLNAAREMPVYIRMQKNWGGFTLTPLASKSTTLIWIGPDLAIWIGYSALDQYLGEYRNRKSQEILGEERESQIRTTSSG
jgi:cytochrome c-type biogenesis protein CcmH/NrfF